LSRTELSEYVVRSQRFIFYITSDAVAQTSLAASGTAHGRRCLPDSMPFILALTPKQIVIGPPLC
jgi:hypothetical protein